MCCPESTVDTLSTKQATNCVCGVIPLMLKKYYVNIYIAKSAWRFTLEDEIVTNSVLYIFTHLFLFWAHISFISQEKNHISKPSAPCTAVSSWSGVWGSEPLPLLTRFPCWQSLQLTVGSRVVQEPLCQGADDCPARQWPGLGGAPASRGLCGVRVCRGVPVLPPRLRQARRGPRAHPSDPRAPCLVQFQCDGLSAAGVAAAAGFAEACLQLTEADTVEQPGGRCRVPCSFQRRAWRGAVGQEHGTLSGSREVP